MDLIGKATSIEKSSNTSKKTAAGLQALTAYPIARAEAHHKEVRIKMVSVAPMVFDADTI